MKFVCIASLLAYATMFGQPTGGNAKSGLRTDAADPSLESLRLLTISGNPNLLPKLSKTLDLGLIYQGKAFQPGFNYFRSQQSNEIVAVKIGTRAMECSSKAGSGT